MNGSTAKTPRVRAMMGKLVIAMTLAGVIGGVAVPARADDDWRRRERHAPRDGLKSGRDYVERALLPASSCRHKQSARVPRST